MQGQSFDNTENKLRGFCGFFGTNLRIFKNINGRFGNRFRYFHFDANAGCGFNSEVDVIGSPVAFSRMATEILGDRYIFHACDKDRNKTIVLAGTPEFQADDNSFVVTGDNREFVECIPDWINEFGENPKNAIGSILFDPNNTEGIPWNELESFSTACPKIDIAINFPGNAMKRAGKTNKNWVGVEDLPTIMNRRYLSIREPSPRWQFSLIVGRNAPIGIEHKIINTVSWDSIDGRSYRTILANSSKEIEKIPSITGQRGIFD